MSKLYYGPMRVGTRSTPPSGEAVGPGMAVGRSIFLPRPREALAV